MIFTPIAMSLTKGQDFTQSNNELMRGITIMLLAMAGLYLCYYIMKRLTPKNKEMIG